MILLKMVGYKPKFIITELAQKSQVARLLKAVFVPFFDQVYINFIESFVLSCFRKERKISYFFKLA